MKAIQIRTVVLGAAIACVAGGCSQAPGGLGDLAGGAAVDTAGAASVLAAGGLQDAALAASAAGLASLPARNVFADLPDRGDLVAYPAKPVVRRESAYTWHRVDFSEEHALRAIASGELRMTAPSGELLRFRYDRHIEHDNGDLTWIGHAIGGTPADDAILTFGASAVLGTVAQPGGSALRVEMRDGASWVVETDRVALAALSKATGRYDKPDYIVPNRLPRADATPASVQPLAARPASAAASAKVVVDVLVGYTPGFYSANLGGPGLNIPFHQTKLNSMVAITNESYVNSGLDMEVRLVHAMQVDYPDATGNSQALYELTGGNADGEVAIPPALQALRAAREQHGADLVSLVRRYQSPENASCGVAWLVGGGQQDISDPGWGELGYSVVSDGFDGGSFCEDTTFAHELGHNMGLAHDVDTMKGDDGVLQSNEYGRYSYSFGYRTGPTEGHFYTVMAYNDDQVTGYRVFSNPRITFCGGFQCGKLNQADNALTLQSTGPVIAAFRGESVPAGAAVRHDYDGDGRSDILWRHSGNGRNALWLAGNANNAPAVGDVGNLAWKVVGSGDFDGDGEADILWRNSSSGQNTIWLGADANRTRAVATVSNRAWIVAGIGDFDGDGISDVLWRNTSSGENTIWRSADVDTGWPVANVPNRAWHVAGIGDFDADGVSDIVWRNHSSGQNTVWLGADHTKTLAITTVPNQAWAIVAVDDFDGDGRADVLWRRSNNGDNTLWLTGNSATPRAITNVPDTNWRVAASGDYDGDGVADLLWRHAKSGANTLWYSAQTAQSQRLATVADTRWQVVP